MQNRQPEKIPKAMLRLMFALVVFVLLAVSVARVSGLSLVGTPPQSEVVAKASLYLLSGRRVCTVLIHNVASSEKENSHSSITSRSPVARVQSRSMMLALKIIALRSSVTTSPKGAIISGPSTSTSSPGCTTAPLLNRTWAWRLSNL